MTRAAHSTKEKAELTVSYARSYMSNHDDILRRIHGDAVIDHLKDCLDNGKEPHLNMDAFMQSCKEYMLDGVRIDAGIKRARWLADENYVY